MCHKTFFLFSLIAVANRLCATVMALPVSSLPAYCPRVTGLAAIAPTSSPTREVGRLPALGWNSWNAFRRDISADRIMSAANALVSTGLKDIGYKYVNIDDAWSQTSRDSVTGRLLPDFSKFPDGIDGVATQIHALGLKVGINANAGTQTCGGFPGSLGHELLDAQTFSEWGIDYLKYGNCNVPGNWTDEGIPQLNIWYNSNSAIRFRYMIGALETVSRPIEFNIVNWGTAHVTEWGAQVGHSWRVWYDSSPTWDYISYLIYFNAGLIKSTNFYGHNDMDMMQIGNGNLTIQEVRTHFAAWIFMKSPIILGTDLNKLSSAHLEIIKNRELLAFHQDTSIGVAAAPFTAFNPMPATSLPEYYAGASSRGIHVFIVNSLSTTAEKTFEFSKVPGLDTSNSRKFQVHDMWSGRDLSGTYDGSSTFKVDVESHDTVAYLIKPVQPTS